MPLSERHPAVAGLEGTPPSEVPTNPAGSDITDISARPYTTTRRFWVAVRSIVFRRRTRIEDLEAIADQVNSDMTDIVDGVRDDLARLDDIADHLALIREALEQMTDEAQEDLSDRAAHLHVAPQLGEGS